MTEQDNEKFTGVWYCYHWYPNKDDSAEEMTKNRMQAQVRGHDLVLQSEPNSEGSYMFVRLTIDDKLATGTWHESTSPEGNFKGAMYSGAGQLIISDDDQHMEGKWAGIGYDRKANTSKIYTGRWELSRDDR